MDFIKNKKDGESALGELEKGHFIIKQNTDKLISDVISLRDRYFDANGNIKNLKIGGDSEKFYDIKLLIKHLFSSEKTIQNAIETTSSSEAEELIKKYEKSLLEIFGSLLEVVHHPSRNIAIGHDSVHAAYDGYEVLDYVKGINDSAQRIATYFGSLVHDAGRTDEAEFVGGQMLDDRHALYSMMYLVQELRNVRKRFYQEHATINPEEQKKVEEISKAFFKRVINAVLVHPGFNDTRDPVFHNVQSLDRLAGQGDRFFVRILLADGLHYHKPIYADSKKDYSTKLPNVFGTINDEYDLFHKIEQYARGRFYKPLSPSLEHGNVKMDEQTRQSLVLLLLLSGGYSTKLFKETFYPELTNGSPEEFNNKRDGKKGVLPEKFKKLIQEQQLMTAEERIAMKDMDFLNTLKLDDLCKIVFKQQAMFLKEEDIEGFLSYLDSKNSGIAQEKQYKENIINTMKFMIAKRELDRKSEIKTIEENLQSEDPFKKLIAEKLIQHPLWNKSLDEILDEMKISK